MQVTFRHMEASPALRDYATEKLEHVLNKYLRSTADTRVVLSVEKFWHIAQFTLLVRGLRIKSEEKSEDMYSSIDLALDKLERQLRRYKDKIRGHKPVHGVEELPFGLEVIAGFDDDETPKDASESNSELEYMDVSIDGGEGHEHTVTVLRSEMHAAKPMTVAEAIMQMDLEDLGFLVFTRADTESINVVYKQEDGNYALVETRPREGAAPAAAAE